MDDTNGPVAAFAHDLRALRNRAGNPSYRELARRALFAPSVLSSAASGHRLPTLPVTLAFVAACGGDRAMWERRWREVARAAGTQTECRDERAPAAGQPDPAAEPPPARPFVPAVSNVARPAQLPMGSGTFVGRRPALASATQLVGQAGSVKTPLMISGPIGVGKTTLALRLADEVSAEFPDGQLYADLSACGSSNQSSNGIVRGFLQALGVPASLVPDDPTQRIGLYRSLLAQCRLFVLLENVRDECQVRPLLARATHSQIVVTSRARLLGLDGVHRIDLDVFQRQESIALIGRLAGAERIQAEQEAAEVLAEACDDLPLAVNIVGRKIAARPEWAVAYTAGQLLDRDRLLESLSVGDVNVRDQFTAAYQLLAPTCRQALRELGRNGPGWTTAIGLAAAMGVPVETADELLESLVDAGLLTRASVASRYRISNLVSAFASGTTRGAMPVAVPFLDRRMQWIRRPVDEPRPPPPPPPRTAVPRSVPPVITPGPGPRLPVIGQHHGAGARHHHG